MLHFNTKIDQSSFRFFFRRTLKTSWQPILLFNQKQFPLIELLFTFSRRENKMKSKKINRSFQSGEKLNNENETIPDENNKDFQHEFFNES